MSLVIPDELLEQTGLSEAEARTEVACHLFDKGLLPLWPAAKFARLGRAEFEAELRSRNIAVYRPTVEDFQTDLKTLDQLGI
jgi:predicted HTH domain antitoxin